MTNKEFVLSICPEAKVKQFYMHGYMIYSGFDGNKWDTQGLTEKTSWAKAANILRERMLQKLES
jgi:hypothetical protein